MGNLFQDKVNIIMLWVREKGSKRHHCLIVQYLPSRSFVVTSVGFFSLPNRAAELSACRDCSRLKPSTQKNNQFIQYLNPQVQVETMQL